MDDIREDLKWILRAAAVVGIIVYHGGTYPPDT